jgi:hypothetical protein
MIAEFETNSNHGASTRMTLTSRDETVAPTSASYYGEKADISSKEEGQ